jgi:hypothetical protein
MTKDEIILRHIINLLLKAESIKNISDACRQEGYSRSSYYKYRARYIKYGTQGLKDTPRKAPVMPNTTRDDVVAKVLDIAKKYPAYGPARLANELGHIVCAATVYNILRRNGLARKLSRLLCLEEIPSDVKISPILARKLSSLKPASIYSPRPGYMLSADTFYVCTLKGVPKSLSVCSH